MSSKGYVQVQTIKSDIMSIYDELTQKLSTQPQVDARISIQKAVGEKPRQLKHALKSFKDCCSCRELKCEIDGVLSDVEDMLDGGDTRLYVCHNKESRNKTELEFVCLAVRTYTSYSWRALTGEKVVDYYMASYTFQKTTNEDLAVVGVSSIGAGAAFGLFALATGGVGGVVLGAIGYSLGVIGAAATASAFDTNITSNMKKLLEASFLYEMVSQGYARIDSDRKLYITFK